MTQYTVQTPLEDLTQHAKEDKDGATEAESPVSQKLIHQAPEEFHEVMDYSQTTQRQPIQIEKMAMLGQLMAGIAHEINTPIASINSNIDLFARSLDKIKAILDSDSMPEEVRGNRKMMRAVNILETLNQSDKIACDRIVRIVQSVRNFARADMTELREIDIHDELENALTLIHHEVKRRIEVVRNYGDIPRCTCFPNRLSGVFVNILANASQAIEGEGQITIETIRDGDNIKVKITDTGEGIPPENMERLFEPGFTTKPVNEGTGLGLPICKRIIHEHHGKIEMESEVGKGTAFTVTLPIGQEGCVVKPKDD
ncbi:sensor histidine kinase [Candidatus Poribacteria bacterium]